MHLARLQGPLRRVAASSSRPFSAPLRTTTARPTTAASLEEQLAHLRIASPTAANAAVEGRRYASVKSQGAYKLKSKKTIAKKMGAKKTGGMSCLAVPQLLPDNTGALQVGQWTVYGTRCWSGQDDS
jgi:protein phosphatase inhibitor 2